LKRFGCKSSTKGGKCHYIAFCFLQERADVFQIVTFRNTYIKNCFPKSI